MDNSRVLDNLKNLWFVKLYGCPWWYFGDFWCHLDFRFDLLAIGAFLGDVLVKSIGRVLAVVILVLNSVVDISFVPLKASHLSVQILDLD